MNKKLLDTTLQFYIWFSVIVLLTSAPIFYYATQRLFINDADEALMLLKNEFLQNNIHTLRTEDISVWNKFNRDIKIETADSELTTDSIFHTFYLDTLANENEPYRVLYSPIVIDHVPYKLLARINLVESEDIVLNVALLFCITLVTLLLGLYFITKSLSSKIWKPFYSTLQQVEQFELDQDNHPSFLDSNIEEFLRLNQSVSRLLERNTASYKNQKEFIENASHELQTPLATFQAKLDTLAQQLPFTKELGDILTDLNSAIARLNRINKNLLLLSKMDNRQFITSDKVSVSDVLQKQSSFLIEQAEERKIRVHILAIDPLTIQVNTTLLEIAFNNLLLNAIRHNIEGGKIIISLTQNALVISNTSNKSKLDTDKLFQRFSYPGQEGGNGLGLSILKKIADLYEWKLEYQYSDDMHHFKVNF